MTNRLRGNFLSGIVTSITAGNPATLVLAAGLNIAIPSGYYLPIVLNPTPYVAVSGTSNSSEIVWTSGTYSLGTTSFTVSRAEEGSSSLGAQTNIPYAIGPTTQDFGILNGMINGDFPIPTASGQYLAASASGIGTVYWHQGTTSATISGSQLVGWVSAALISGNLSGPVTVPGADITGSISNATIPGSSITGGIPASEISGVFENAVLQSPIEQAWINATAPNGTMNLYVVTNGTSVLCTNAATANFSFNISATSSTTLNSLLSIGQEITLAVKTTQGSTAYYCTFINVDGVAQTINWQGGNSPSAGNPNGLDVYTINITKTAANTYTVLANLARFAS
jgi:hypothetical protein